MTRKIRMQRHTSAQEIQFYNFFVFQFASRKRGNGLKAFGRNRKKKENILEGNCMHCPMLIHIAQDNSNSPYHDWMPTTKAKLPH